MGEKDSACSSRVDPDDLLFESLMVAKAARTTRIESAPTSRLARPTLLWLLEVWLLVTCSMCACDLHSRCQRSS